MSEITPVLFISYSWTSPDHEAWVLELAEQLLANGVDVRLDKWDLKEGQDSIAFMEQMVTDPTVTHVAMISDEAYAAKADGRVGGVGTETTIISKKVYEAGDQSKFVVVIPSRDSHGKPCVPTYYGGRIYIDLSDAATSAAEFEKLLRWLYGKPLHVKPVRGDAPSFLAAGPRTSMGTEVLRHRAEEAVRGGKVFAVPAMEEFFEKFASSLHSFECSDDPLSEEALLAAIEKTLFARNEVLRVFKLIAQYDVSDEMMSAVRRFFESCMAISNRHIDFGGKEAWRRDPIRFLVGELFLYFVAVMLDRERIESVIRFISPVFYSSAKDGMRQVESGYWTLEGDMESESALGRHLNKTSARAYLLKTRSEGSGVAHDSLVQADICIWLRTVGLHGSEAWWFPVTPVYVTRFASLEIFARSVSVQYLSRLLPLFGAQTKDEFVAPDSSWMRAVKEWRLPGSHRDLTHSLNLDKLGTKP
ncbi:toll/interleukin-1 receptor domain-containing protein [Stenotrophomonas lacuserhaii]|uniref:toll/interleukin-1 receptor domain-containing protein n=1 Tax=Stenotrophomonas lacuserhaii TaxID=2760084 RepID=UPI0032EF3837